MEPGADFCVRRAKASFPVRASRTRQGIAPAGTEGDRGGSLKRSGGGGSEVVEALRGRIAKRVASERRTMIL